MARERKLIADRLAFGEAPRWHAGRLWFSDFFDHAVKSVTEAGDLRIEFELDDRPSGLGWCFDGSLLVVSMTNRAVLRRTTDGRLSHWADLSDLATFHCNDMVVDAKGGAYVGNFGFDLNRDMDEKGVEAVLADHPTANLVYVSPSGVPRIVADEMHFPNGSAISTDHNTLLVAETLAGAITAFDISDDGSLSNRRLWAPTWPRVPDGIALDASGAIWIANPLANECVRIAEGGAVLDVVETDRPCYACALGGADGKSLFMLTAEPSDERTYASARSGHLWAVAVEVPGADVR